MTDRSRLVRAAAASDRLPDFCAVCHRHTRESEWCLPCNCIGSKSVMSCAATCLMVCNLAANDATGHLCLVRKLGAACTGSRHIEARDHGKARQRTRRLEAVASASATLNASPSTSESTCVVAVSSGQEAPHAVYCLRTLAICESVARCCGKQLNPGQQGTHANTILCRQVCISTRPA